MPKLKCPKCEKGDLVRKTLERFDTKLGGIPFVIHNAEAWQCAECGHVVATGKDIKHWREVQKAYLQAQGFAPSPEAVRKLRESLGISVADLAALLAITRQTVHAWQQQGLNALQVGPAAILLRLLAKELSEDAVPGLLKALAEEAHARGQSTPRLSQLVTDQGKPKREEANLSQSRNTRNPTSCSTSSSKGDQLCLSTRRTDNLTNSPQQAVVERLIRQNGSVWCEHKKAGKAA